MATVDTRMSDPVWTWGVTDCVCMAGTVFADLWGVDPIASRRGGWSSVRTAWRETRARLGVEMRAAFRVAGLARVAERSGAIGVLPDLRWGGHAAVCLVPGAWAVRVRGGYVVMEPTGPADAWGLPDA